jgi:hypothetical protein
VADEPKDYKVVDKRSFTPEGEERPSEQGEPPTVEERLREKEQRRRAREAARTGTPPPPPDAAALPRIDFTTFVISLAHSAAIHLGAAPHPETGETHRDLALAKETIDILSMLEEKTRGNLTAQEKEFFESLLFDLRIRYVEATRAPAAEPAKG